MLLESDIQEKIVVDYNSSLESFVYSDIAPNLEISEDITLDDLINKFDIEMVEEISLVFKNQILYDIVDVVKTLTNSYYSDIKELISENLAIPSYINIVWFINYVDNNNFEHLFLDLEDFISNNYSDITKNKEDELLEKTIRDYEKSVKSM